MSKKYDIPEEIEGRKVYYYYLTMDRRLGLDDMRKLPIKYGVVAFVVHDEDDTLTVSRGISLCSWLDNFDKRKGRALAAARLQAALSMQDSADERVYRGRHRNSPDCEEFLLRQYKEYATDKEFEMFEHDKRKEDRENGKNA